MKSAKFRGGFQFAGSVAIVTLCVAVDSHASVRYVDASAPSGGDGKSWSTAYDDIQDALAEALSDHSDITSVHMAGGTYRPSSPGINPGDWIFALVGGISYQGGYAGVKYPNPDERDIEQYPTILNGLHLQHAQNSYHVVRPIPGSVDLVLDGVVITNGRADGGLLGFRDRGGAAYLNDVEMTFVDCVIINNTASNVGGGLWIDESEVSVVRCRFQANDATGGGAIHNVFSSSLTLKQCTFQGNKALGHTGGAVFNGSSATMMANGCIFVRNQANVAGGALRNDGVMTTVNCEFIANRATLGSGSDDYHGRGGAIINARSLDVINCTFHANQAVRSGGAVHSNGGIGFGAPVADTRIVNSILWENSAGDDSLTADVDGLSAEVLVRYSCLTDLPLEFASVGNIFIDPQFLDMIGPDGMRGSGDEILSLMSSSPCIDAGDNDYVPRDVTEDIDGLWRFADGNGDGVTTVDMGAYEFAGINTCIADLVASETRQPPPDGTVDPADLAFLLSEWGNNPGSLADIVTSATFSPPPDGVIDGADLAFLLGAWGTCD